jgi:UDP-N-acetylglucosamine 2-epimerase
VNREATVAVVFGTRPEAIKLAPVIRLLESDQHLRVRVIATGQHREMLDQVLAVFGITPDRDLRVMTTGQSLSQLTARLLALLDPVFAKETPDAVIVQGDTATACAAALAAYYRRIPVGHVEAGLRTGDRYAPFPEEVNRRLVSVLATWHFAPTERARDVLVREGNPAESVAVTGNTVIDALRYVLATTPAPPSLIPERGQRMIVVTAHRRESFGPPFEALCRAIRRIADGYPDVDMCYPVHLNPRVQEPVQRLLAGHPRIHLLAPLDYVAFVHLLTRAYLVLSDSGGVQEEAPALGKPVLVMRDATDRPEAVEAGVAKLVGTNEERIVASVSELLDEPRTYATMAQAANPYGDGHASERIVAFLRSRLLAHVDDAELPG